MAEDPLELDHVFGYTGALPSTLVVHPQDADTILYAIGGLVVVETLNERHSQTFLRGHDAEVTYISVSSDGILIASGQNASPRARTGESPVILWNYRSKAPIAQFRGLAGSIKQLKFSPDSAFLAGCAENGAFVIWDCGDGSIVYSKRFDMIVQALEWGPVRDSNQGLRGAGKHPSYSVMCCHSNLVTVNTLDFNIGNMSYILSTSNCQLPSSGLTRTYTAAVKVGDYLIAGTTSGELCVFNLISKIFRASIPVSSNGITSLLEVRGEVLVGSGDGTIKKLVGEDNRWNIVAQTSLAGKITSLGAAADGTEFLAGTSLGAIYRVLTRDLVHVFYSESHIGSVNDVSFGARSDQFCTIDKAGFVRLWDSSDYVVLFRAGPSARPEGTSCAIGDDGTILTGWGDGGIRCYNPQTSTLVWEINSAHRGPVTALFFDNLHIISGGSDGIVRLWSRRSHSLLTQFSDNRKQIVRIFRDVAQPHLIHSCGFDRSLNTYDLKLERRVVRHEIGNGALCDMTQRKDNENELITSGVGCGILFWDCDEKNPISQIQFAGTLTALQISPVTGRFIAAGSSASELFIFELNGRCVAQGVAHSKSITRLHWSPDERQIVTLSEDCSVAIWNFYA
mmetsp:Transcript_12766/g.23776  ORF Transcript_12766/g.23776 Transcript_12766/m.23776 type:complete len:622 (+) Transcript_12766:2683-4548(+)